MTPKLSVVVHVDMDARHVRVAVTGHLTTTNQQGLHPVIDHVRTLFPEVTVDLTATDHPDPHAVAQLRQALDHAAGPPRPITILTPVTPSARNHPGRTAKPSHSTSPRESAPAPRTAVPHCSRATAPKNPQHPGAPARTGLRCAPQVPAPAALHYDSCRRDSQQAPPSISTPEPTPRGQAGAGHVLGTGGK